MCFLLCFLAPSKLAILFFYLMATGAPILIFFSGALQRIAFLWLRLGCVAGWLRRLLQAEQRILVCHYSRNCFCSLCVDVAVLILSHVCVWMRLVFGFWLRFVVWWDVGTRFSPHVQHASMLSSTGCGCGGTYHRFFSPQESEDAWMQLPD